MHPQKRTLNNKEIHMQTIILQNKNEWTINHYNRIVTVKAKTYRMAINKLSKELKNIK